LELRHWTGLAFVPQDKLDFNCKYAKVQWFLVHKVLIKFMNKVLKYFLHQKYGLGDPGSVIRMQDLYFIIDPWRDDPVVSDDDGEVEEVSSNVSFPLW